ncbi:MAG: hypothetical protein U0136_07575 [Bdellovibrionota bacterium]
MDNAENNQSLSSLEKWAALVLAFTALATAWSAYQSSRWEGVQTFKLNEARTQQTLAEQEILKLNQRRSTDGMLVLTIAEALVEGRTNTIDYFVPRMRPELRAVLERWLALDPLHNPNAPAHPLVMPEYSDTILKEFQDREQSLRKSYQDNLTEAQNAGAVSESYVLLTVLFALVLFFAGISSTFRSSRIEGTLLLLGTVILLATLCMLAQYPVAAG